MAFRRILGLALLPWDVSLGLNWYPWRIPEVRLASELVYMSASAVGSSSTPYAVGGHGVVFHANLELYF
jgi:hypothetical protein